MNPAELPSEMAIAEPEVFQEEKTQDATGLPWNVVVHNDPITKMNYVTMVFRRVFGYSRERSEKHMMEVHHMGRSILWSGARERAEMFVQELHTFQLLATLERAS